MNTQEKIIHYRNWLSIHKDNNLGNKGNHLLEHAYEKFEELFPTAISIPESPTPPVQQVPKFDLSLLPVDCRKEKHTTGLCYYVSKNIVSETYGESKEIIYKIITWSGYGNISIYKEARSVFWAQRKSSFQIYDSWCKPATYNESEYNMFIQMLKSGELK